nr:putative serine/threonine-protein kinase receptor [Quercus suber]
MDIFTSVLLSSSLLLLYLVFSDAADSITQSQFISDSNGTTLISKDEGFALGFFSPGNSTNRYLGIWYNKIPGKTVVWVANRGTPITDSSGVLMVNSSGSLVLLGQNLTVAWSVNSTKEARNPILKLLDSGNLVLREENEGNYLWQSFDYPSDTWLAGMKLGWDLRIGLERRLTAWRSPDDPSPGELSWGFELHNYPELVMKKGSKKFFRSGPWNGNFFSGMPELQATPLYNFTFVSNNSEVYFKFEMIEKSAITRAVLNQSQSQYQRYMWVEEKKEWSMFLNLPKDKCDSYNLCGPYGNCIMDTRNGGSGCAMWFGELIDIRQMAANKEDANSQDIYIRMPASEQAVKNKQKMKVIVIVVVAIAVVFGVLLIPYCICRTKNLRDQMENSIMLDQNIELQSEDLEVPFFSLATIVIATNNFSSDNKLGEGGFGLVYKGTLTDGHEIAVKRLSRNQMENSIMLDQNIELQSEDLEVPFFSLATIVIATNNFSSDNKLGEGGFGLVYKGTLTDGHEIAVKRLSRKILSGKKNRGFIHPGQSLNLVAHAWNLWKECRSLELLDTCLEDCCIILEFFRCLHISFLCLQQHHEDRPNMSSVVMMLHGESLLPEPKEPASFIGKRLSLSSKNQSPSPNEITITLLEAR